MGNTSFINMNSFILLTDAVCCPDIITEDVVMSNMIGDIAENTAYTQCLLA